MAASTRALEMPLWPSLRAAGLGRSLVSVAAALPLMRRVVASAAKADCPETIEGRFAELTGFINYFLRLQDKINSFWEITKKELEDKKAELRNKEREMEELEERHQACLQLSYSQLRPQPLQPAKAC